MQISVLGRTDKRPCIYTLMKMLQPMGDVLVVTSNVQYLRLIEEDAHFGYYQNIAIYVTNETADELWYNSDLDKNEYDHIILDGLYNENSDVVFYVQGAGVEALDEDAVSALSDILITIKMGTGKGKAVVPYTKDMMEKLECIEYYRKLVCPSAAMAQVLSNALAEHLHMSAKNLLKVVNKK